MIRRVLLLGALLGFASCVHLPKIASSPHHVAVRRSPLQLAAAIPASEMRNRRAAVVAPPEPADAVVLVTLDGVRWQEIFSGTEELHQRDPQVPLLTAEELMPTLSRWSTHDGSSLGAPGFGPMRATGPNYLSLPGYTEIMTGRSPSECQNNFCGVVRVPTIADEMKQAFPDDHVSVVSSWESIAFAASPTLRGIDLSTGRLRARGISASWLDAGRRSDAWPGVGEYRADVFTMKVALRVLETDRPRFLFVGLGDTDEHAHHGDVKSYVGALQAADSFLDLLEQTLAKMGERGRRTAIFVACDHGRNSEFRQHGGEWPESGRVWLVAKGAGIAASGKVDSTDARLADIAPTIRELFDLPRDEAPDAGKPLGQILE